MTKRLEVPMEEALRYRAEFEQLITSISTHFINLSPEQIDFGVLHALQSIGEFAEIDRSAVFLFNGSDSQIDNTHEWCAPGIEPPSDKLQTFSPEHFSWWSEKLKAHEIVQIPKVAAMPPEARAEQDFLQTQRFQSALLVPMVRENSLIGFLGFGSIRSEKHWPKETLALLKVVGEIVANALARKRAEQELRASERKYRSLFENSFDGVYQSTPEGKILTANPALVRLLGFESEEELLKADINSLYVDPEERRRNISRLEKDGELRNVELHLKRKDGEQVIL
ncbi:MAG TPA: PAS domain S-box protein, partial [Acidobacteriota bacterium]